MVDKKFAYSVKKSYSTQILQKLFTLMHQCMGGCTYYEGMSTGGSWIKTEKNWRLKSIVKDHGIHVKVFSDSTTAIACINKLGISLSELCHYITKQIWE